MPIVKQCCHPGCTRFRLDGSSFCDKHQADQIKRDQRKQEWLSNRQANNKAPYYRSYRWHKESAEFIKAYPYCAVCGSTDNLQVHHHWPRNYDYNNDADFWDKGRWITLCARCHQQATHTNNLNNVIESLLR